MNVATTLLTPLTEGAPHETPSPKLVKAANAFEANFLGELLKPMREDPLFGNGSGLGGDSLGSEGSSSGSMGTIGSLASEALAQAIVKQGGLGIAKMVLDQLSPVEKTAAQAAQPVAGPNCDGCASALTITQATATSLDVGNGAMLGKGTVTPAFAQGGPGNSTKKLAPRIPNGASDEDSLSLRGLIPVGARRK
jgi:Rod binding domain-containing protein